MSFIIALFMVYNVIKNAEMTPTNPKTAKFDHFS